MLSFAIFLALMPYLGYILLGGAVILALIFVIVAKRDKALAEIEKIEKSYKKMSKSRQHQARIDKKKYENRVKLYRGMVIGGVVIFACAVLLLIAIAWMTAVEVSKTG